MNVSRAEVYPKRNGEFVEKDHTVRERNHIRDSVSIGDNVKFYRLIRDVDRFGKVRSKEVKIEGVVIEKYPYIFKLDNGVYYTWTDYMFGRHD